MHSLGGDCPRGVGPAAHPAYGRDSVLIGRTWQGLIVRIIALCLVTTVLLLLLSRLYALAANNSYQKNKHDTIQFDYVPATVDVACFGTSHSGNSFPPQLYTEGTLFQFGMAQQMPPMSAALYRKYKDRFAEQAIIVMTMSYFSPYYYNLNNVREMKRFCTFLSVDEIPSPLMQLYSLFRIIDYEPEVMLHIGDTSSFSGQAFTTSTVATQYSAEELAEMGASSASGHLGFALQGPPDRVDDAADEAIRYMIEDALSSGFRPVLYVAPYLSQYNVVFPDDFCARFDADLADYAAQYNIPYLNYSHDPRFTDSPELFVDPGHLTTDGAQKIMDLLFPEIEAFYAARDPAS